MNISKKTILLLQEKLNVPKNYTVFFTSSATECWEIISQSVIKDKSYHLYNGAFGQKWFDYTKRIKVAAEGISFPLDEKLEGEKLGFKEENAVICITQNETSNGTQVSVPILKSIKRHNPTSILAIDATSSMAGIKLDFRAADIWFASVQKCFGLPAGLGLLICSPGAMQRAENIAERGHYNSVTFMKEMMDKWQTPATPNVLGIYLLMRVLENSAPIEEVHHKVFERYKAWADFLSESKNISHLIKAKSVQSYTVIPVMASAEIVQNIKSTAKQKGLLLGEGYGSWKPNTFRIANFPALRKKEIRTLMSFLAKF